jgi:hypothetical protein
MHVIVLPTPVRGHGWGPARAIPPGEMVQRKVAGGSMGVFPEGVSAFFWSHFCLKFSPGGVFRNFPACFCTNPKGVVPALGVGEAAVLMIEKI